MLYHLFPQLNPMLAILVIGPLLAAAAGFIGRRSHRNILWSAAFSLLIPLLFIAQDLATLTSNWDAWIIYGLAYAAVALLAQRLSGTKKSGVS